MKPSKHRMFRSLKKSIIGVYEFIIYPFAQYIHNKQSKREREFVNGMTIDKASKLMAKEIYLSLCHEYNQQCMFIVADDVDRDFINSSHVIFDFHMRLSSDARKAYYLVRNYRNEKEIAIKVIEEFTKLKYTSVHIHKENNPNHDVYREWLVRGYEATVVFKVSDYL